MPTNEDGEFELILGNKQLLSVFAIVAILLGIFFALGYVVGRNSAPVDVGTRRAEPAYVRSEGPSAMDNPASKRAEERGADAASDRASALPADSRPPSATPAKSQSQPARSVDSEPPPGQTFLQVAAVAKSEADILVQVLRRKGFPARSAAGPNNLTRVIVGPAKDTGETAKLRTELEQAGFKSFVKKY